MSSVDTFIQQAEIIVEKSRKVPTLAFKTQREGRALLKQFEKFLKARGLEAPARMRRVPKAQHCSRQRRSCI
jgi:hypothetical protein